MDDYVDILAIDTKIRNSFTTEHERLPAYKKRLLDIQRSITNINSGNKRLQTLLTDSQEKLETTINELEKRYKYNFYIINSVPLIEKYRAILDRPIKLTFTGKKVKKNKEKLDIIRDYIRFASGYVDDINVDNSDGKITCLNCFNRQRLDVVDRDSHICKKCYAQQNIIKYKSSYSDMHRVNVATKYMYDRKIHFRDCIKQYQGKQNSTIPTKIYDQLKEQFERHHLLVGDNTTCKEERYKNITKKHIMIFLKDLGYPNHYENVHLIHYNLTNIKPDDIGDLEEKLLDDFDALTTLYDNLFKHINRKNFINTQYVLYQLLQRHKHPCKKEEFIILKTIDRKFFHDEVCKLLFEHLNWNHTPFY